MSPFGGPERCLSALRSGPPLLLLAAAAACCCGCEAAWAAAAAGAAAAAQLGLAGQAGDLTAQAIKPSLLLQLLLATHRRLALPPRQARYCQRAAAADAAAAAVAVQPPLPATPCFARWVRYRPPGNGVVPRAAAAAAAASAGCPLQKVALTAGTLSGQHHASQDAWRYLGQLLLLSRCCRCYRCCVPWHGGIATGPFVVNGVNRASLYVMSLHA